MGKNTKHQVLSFSLGSKEVLWLADGNKYLLAEPLAADVVLEISKGNPASVVSEHIAAKYDVEHHEASELVEQIETLLLKNKAATKNKATKHDLAQTESISAFYAKKKYRINQVLMEVEYESSDAEWYNHPKFAHLETESADTPDHHFRVRDSDGQLSLWVDGKHAGSWPKHDNHFLSGGFSMKVIEKMYRKEEKDWMGVFHAAGISNGRQCLLFFGESGNGKSTLSALCMAAGLDVLSDDFLPVESESRLVYRFPAALSIKKTAYDLLKKPYPEISNAKEFENPAFGKIFRFLPPKSIEATAVPCKAIIHVKYDPDTRFKLEETPAEDLFARLVPDSWINASAKNAENFISWFKGQRHFILCYSDNKKMTDAIKQLLDE